MEQATDILGQIRKVWSRFNTAQRVGVGAVTALVFGGVLLAAMWAGRPDYRRLGVEMDPKQAGAAMSRFDEEGIDYKVHGDGMTILVDVDDLESARRLLTQEGLAKTTTDEGAGGLFGGNSTINKSQQAWKNARETELRVAKTLTAFDFIEIARVTITPAKWTYHKSGRQPAKASVQIDTRSTLSDHQIQSVTHTVAQAVEGLNPDHVTIQDTHGIVLKHPNDGGDNGLKSTFLKHQKSVEYAKASRAQEALDFVYGAGKTHVTVDVEIDWTRSQTRETKYDPSSGITRMKEKNEKTSSSSRKVPGGTVGSRLTATDNGSPATQDIQTSVTEQKDFDRTETELVKLGGDIKRMSAAVFIDETLADQQTSIQKTLAAALGINETRGDSIALHSATIVGTPEVDLQEERQAAESTATIFAWAEYGAYALLGLLFLFFSLRTIKKTQSSLREVLEKSLEEEEAKKKAEPEPLPLENTVLQAVQANSDLAGRSLKRWLYEPVGE